ncbi:MAG: valine--tRNA ligase [Pseudomonadota bacterium]
MPMEKTFYAAEAEPRIYAAWEAIGAFAAGANATRDETFCILLPPPNVTGFLHAGHAFNHTLMDILTRWKRMQGYDTLWQPGLDHAGIATQLVVERQLAEAGGPSRRALGREAFLEKVWDWKRTSGGMIVEQDKRLGASMDWSRLAFTMTGAPGSGQAETGPNFHDAVLRVFVDMYNKGMIYRGKRLVNWDPHFETAISDLEVENVETPGHMWHFKYPLADGATYDYVEKDDDGNVTLRETRDYISIATTRPETMLGDGAVAVHPSDQRYAPIVGKLCEIPVGPREHRRLIPIITDEYPDPDFGSGAVKITGAHDFNDYAVAKRGAIPMYRLMDTKGAMRADGAPYAEAAALALSVARGERALSEAEADAVNLVPDDLRGLDRFQARARVVAQITGEGLAVMTTPDDPRLGKPKSKPAPAPEPGPLDDDEVASVQDRDANTNEIPPAEDRGRPGQARDRHTENTRPGLDPGPQPVPLVEAKPIMQPFGDRSKVVIEPMLTDQWFVNAEKIVGLALDAVKNGDTKIIPESGEKVYYHWLENIEPWCISRQLWWGHQIPVWYGPGVEKISADDPRNHGNKECFEVQFEADRLVPFCASSENEALEQAKAYYGQFDRYLLVEFVKDEKESFRRNDDEDGEYFGIWRDPDVLDTWFSSGLWPIGTLNWPGDGWQTDQKYHPTSVLITGQDILFFWVARMMMMQYAVVDEKPFDTVYLHQLVRDEKGVKMSKVLGNVIDPLEIIDEFGADALRFANASMAALGGVLKLSTDRIKGYRNFGTKLWNAVRFAEMNGVYEATPPKAPPAATATANAWIIGETARVRETVDAALEGYRFNDAANALYAFTWGKVCDWYVEFAKPLFDAEATAAETRATMGWVLDQCLVMLHPFMPFITEELWQVTAARPKMLVHADWPDYAADALTKADADREMTWVIGLIDDIRSARAQMHVPAGLRIPMLQVSLDAAGQAAWENNEALIKKLARIASLEKVAETPKGAVTIPVEGGLFCLPLADIIDVGEERARLEKSLSKLEKELGGLRGRLKNPKFVESAPEEVVAETRDNLAAREEEADKVQAALARLAELE